ncbi:MAG TPA: homocysteine S-methyltransferase family protein [Ignavibacteriaceae bacterium]|nr:homocysteine S-methyltransferase family protein [Ignavibacteriaceae bacterium]
MNLFSFAKKINRPLILDGAMGSMLQSFHLKPKGSLWMSFTSIENPEKVLSVHQKYIDAGADIITTNTFRTNPSAVKEYSHRKQRNLLQKSVELAIQARNNLPVLVAGSNAPAEDCYQVKRTLSKKELRYNHHKHIDGLMSAGCDFVLNETQSHLDEIKIISQYCYKNNIPFIVSLFFLNDLKLLSGENLFDEVKFINEYEPIAIGFNCIMPSTFQNVLQKINKNYNWGFYLNCGSGNYSDEIIKCGVSPKEYVRYVKSSLKKKPSFIGACCGSSPNHIKEIKKLLDGRNKS